LTKRYGDVEAVRGISFSVNKGEIFGFIGPDGAGKTTTFQILAGVMRAGGGATDVLGKPARDARAQTGYLTQAFSLYPDMTVMENVRYVGDLRLTPRAAVLSRARHYLTAFGMDRFEDRLASNLSGGMQKKLALVCALVSEPAVLLLDEPTTGVDPVSRREFWDALAQLSNEGLTILVATPYLDEAERCNRVALMHLGEIAKLDTPNGLRNSMHARRLEVHVGDMRRAQLVTPQLSTIGDVLDVQRFGDHLDVLAVEARVTEVEAGVDRVLRAANLPPEGIRTDEPSLENVFVASIRDENPQAKADFPFVTPQHADIGAPAIAADRLVKRFGDFVAVDNLSLAIRFGEIYGLLGANGAGKTTTIRMLCGLLEPSSGAVTLAGERGNVRSEAVRRRVGYMSQKFSLYDDLTILENLEFFAGVYGIAPQQRHTAIQWVLDFSGLRGRESVITGSLPGGWKQRVAFGSAIMHEPDVLFLDEPTSGVDPIARRAFWSMIDRLADRGTALLVTTHYLEEAEQCNRVGFVSAGKLIAEGTPSEVKAQQRGHLIEARVDDIPHAVRALSAGREPWRVSVFGDRLHVVTDEPADVAIAQTKTALENSGVRVLEIREARFSLEDVFIGAVQRAASAA
ncbi:MAG TPA: ATP-binding cassette domain-containing protein, partial [Candidatus Acidoferrales bacterium]|nr:ATP-binding cassette domain-containing protein [Candidatus Acidoferrales bacterium]